MAEREQRDGGTQVITRTRPKAETEQPRRYKVLLHNDDFTTMEFVVWVLMTIFHHEETRATEIMLHIHRSGLGVAGVYSREIAEARVAKVVSVAREHEFPLLCSMEED